MTDQIYTILGMPLTVYLDHDEMIKNFMIVDIHAEHHTPPFDHFVCSFEARCALTDFQDLPMLPREGIAYGSVPKFYVFAGDKIPFYIDSYNVSSSYPNEVHGGGFYGSVMIPPELRTVEISGHFDSRDFEGGYNSTKKRCKLKPPEPIDSRFDILDL
jgi:hypothetical protein